MKFEVKVTRENGYVNLTIIAETPEQRKELSEIGIVIIAAEMLGKNKTRTSQIMVPAKKLEIMFY